MGSHGLRIVQGPGTREVPWRHLVRLRPPGEPMSCTTYNCWRNDGSPWSDCQPTRDFIAMLQRHGYTGPTVGIGDQSHLTANPPEDHCPYSHTPWPGTQPYPRVMAIDIMPGEGVDIIWLGGRLFDDKMSGHPGLAPLKYMNWTDSDGNIWHDSWQPSHTRYRSSDSGHIHISWRTDYVNSTLLATYDPFGSTPQEEDDIVMHFAQASGNDSIYLAPGYAAPSGKMAAYGLTPAAWNAYKPIVSKSVVLPAADFSKFYDTAPQPWPEGSSGAPVLTDHTHSIATATTGTADPV